MEQDNKNSDDQNQEYKKQKNLDKRIGIRMILVRKPGSGAGGSGGSTAQKV